jgi:segregation and condensation protein A
MTEYQVKLDIFEGPLDLLLHLIKEDELNIYDIPIARITKQYCEYIELMTELNLELAGEFLVMASTLTYIKSRTLLPNQDDEEALDDEVLDPRRELLRRLLEYKKYKEAASVLREREMSMSDSHSRNFISEWDQDDTDYLKEVSVFQLLGSFRAILKKTAAGTVYEITLEDVSITEKMNVIMERLSQAPRLHFEDLFESLRSRMELIGTFLALLELMKQSLIRVFQERAYGAIWVQYLDTVETGEKGDLNAEPTAGPGNNQ